MRIGIVSYFAPPQPAVASHRVLRLSRALLKRGHEVHWITVDEALLRERDETLVSLTPKGITRHGLGGPTLWSQAVARNFIEKVKRTLVYELSKWLPIPDPHLEWVLRLKRRLPAIVASERLDAVIITCGPHGQLLALDRLRSAAPDLKIFVDYRDLLSGNSWTGPHSTRTRNRVRKREERALHLADALFVNTKEAHATFTAQINGLPYPVEVMRNAADFQLAAEISEQWPATPTDDGIHLGFFGTIFARRRLLPILEAMAALPDAILEQTTLHAFCGAEESLRMLDEDLSKVRAAVRARVERHGYLPFAEALRSMMSMTALVLMNGSEARDNIFIPGKLYDYLMARRPVLFVGMEGDAWDIIAETSGPQHCFYHNDTAGMAKAIETLATRPADIKDAVPYGSDCAFQPLLDRLAESATGEDA